MVLEYGHPALYIHIDKKGTLVDVAYGVTPDNHAQEVLGKSKKPLIKID